MPPFLLGVRASPPAHAVRTFHPLGVPVLRWSLLHDGGPLHVQHCLLAHEGEGEIRLSSPYGRKSLFPGTMWRGAALGALTVTV